MINIDDRYAISVIFYKDKAKLCAFIQFHEIILCYICVDSNEVGWTHSLLLRLLANMKYLYISRLASFAIPRFCMSSWISILIYWYRLLFNGLCWLYFVASGCLMCVLHMLILALAICKFQHARIFHSYYL